MSATPTITDQDVEQYTQLTQQVLQQARQAGASAAEVSVNFSSGLSSCVRMGAVDTVEFHREKGLGLTVYFDQQKGHASSSDTSAEALTQIVEAACDIAKATQGDPYTGLAEEALLAKPATELPLYYPWSLTAEQAIELAKQCESEALTHDQRIINSEGATLATGQHLQVCANSLGFVGHQRTSRHSLNCVLVAKDAQGMQRDYAYTTARDPQDLWSTNQVAMLAAQRTLDRLDARRLPTGRWPVILTPEIAAQLLHYFIRAISGGLLYRRASFLVDCLGKQIFPTHLTLTEDPWLDKGWGSAAFDDEGVKTTARTLVDAGVLQGYVLGSYSARRLGMQTTGNAGGIHNILIQPQPLTQAQLLDKMDTGLLVTETMGHGVNLVTGDFSQGAVGFWVEQGEIQFPVHEITIAGRLPDMLQNIVAISNDLDNRQMIRTGSMLIEQMTIAGQ
ncbi:MAG: metalloprotease PmbA [Legionellales bacterium]|nr:metalloprotease PmbA [Legionellales bacterium]